MVNRLKPLNQFDFTGGINLRPETFQLAENELPVLLNMEVDPRGGLNVRKGWKATTVTPVTGAAWDPRNGYAHIKSNGDRLVLVANRETPPSGRVYGRLNNANFAPLGTITASAQPHLADFASWDDNVWIVGGNNAAATWDGLTVTPLVASGGANWQDDYTTPGTGKNAPSADLIAQHAGYMFVAGTTEGAVPYPNRIRWSHSNNPYAWAADDYIDLSEGGQRITAMVPYLRSPADLQARQRVGALRLRGRDVGADQHLPHDRLRQPAGGLPATRPACSSCPGRKASSPTRSGATSKSCPCRSGPSSRATASTRLRSTTCGSDGSTVACGARCRSTTSHRPTRPRRCSCGTRCSPKAGHGRCSVGPTTACRGRTWNVWTPRRKAPGTPSLDRSPTWSCSTT